MTENPLTTQAAAKAFEDFFKFLDREIVEARANYKRVAISPARKEPIPAHVGDRAAHATRLSFDVLLIGQGELPPKGWTVYGDEIARVDGKAP